MKEKKTFKENVDDAEVWKADPFDTFFLHGWVASSVVSEPPLRGN